MQLGGKQYHVSHQSWGPKPGFEIKINFFSDWRGKVASSKRQACPFPQCRHTVLCDVKSVCVQKQK